MTDTGTVWDWPNQQVVRADESGPGVDTPPLIEPNESRWHFTTSTSAPSGNGKVAFATADQAAPGTVWVTLVDLEGNDQTERAQRLTTASVIRLEATSGAFQEYLCREAPSLTGGLLTIVDPVHWNAGGLLADGDELAITGYQQEAEPKT